MYSDDDPAKAWSESQQLFKAIVEEDMTLVTQCLAPKQGSTTTGTASDVDERVFRAVNMKDESGMTPLHFAADRGLPEAAEMLLKSGAYVDASDLDGQTPLMLAVMCDHKVR